MTNCTDNESTVEFDQNKLKDEVEIEMGRFYEQAKVFNVDEAMSFFNNDKGIIIHLNSNFFTFDEFKNLLKSEYGKREKQDFIFEEPVIKVLSKDIVLVITKKVNDYYLKTGEHEMRNSSETFIWKKVNNKWMIEFYNGFITKAAEETYRN